MRGVRVIFPYVILFVLSVAFFNSALLPPPDKILRSWDSTSILFFTRSYLVDSIKSGVIPFWDPYSFSGTPFLAHPATEPFYPLTLLFLFVPFHLIFSIYYFIHVYLAGCFMYWYVRRYADEWASLFAAVAYAFSGLMAARIVAGHIEYISSIALLPLVIGSFELLYEQVTRKRIVFAVVVMTLLYFTGNTIAWLFSMELVAILFVIRAYGRGLKGVVWDLAVVGFVSIIAFGIACIWLLPLFEFGNHSMRTGGLSYAQASGGSYTVDMLRLLFTPWAYGNPFTEKPPYSGPWPNYFEFVYFVGMVPWIVVGGMVVWAMWRYMKKRDLRVLRGVRVERYVFYVVAIIFFVAVALGSNFFLHKILYAFVGPYKFIRIPARHLLMVTFLIPALSGLSLSYVKKPVVKMLLIVVLVYELFSYSSYFIGTDPYPVRSYANPLAEYIKKNIGLHRVFLRYETWDIQRQVMELNAGDYHKFPVLNGYGSMIVGNYYRFFDVMNAKETSSFEQYPVELPPTSSEAQYLDYLNVKYVLHSKARDDISGKVQKYSIVYPDPFYTLYENKQVKPRFFLVGKSDIQPSTENAEEVLRRGVDLGKTVVYDAPVGASLDCEGSSDIGSVDVKEYTAHRITLLIDANCTSVLSSSEVMYPGWKASIDGKEVPILTGNMAFRTLPMAKGQHMVVMWYEPTIWVRGALVSLGSIVALVIFLIALGKYQKSNIKYQK